MLIIKTNQPNTLVVTVSQNSELTNPEYLFSFTHIFSKQNISFIPTDISTHKSRYDEFYFVEGSGAGQVRFPYQGQYLYAVYEQPQGSGNLNPALAFNVVENGDAQVFPSTASTMDSQYDIFISNNEDNSNFIFAPGEIIPAPTPSPTSSPLPISPTPTPSITPTFTPTPSSTPPPNSPLSLGATWWIDFTYTPSLTIDSGNVRIALDRISNVPFSAASAGPIYNSTGYLGVSGTAQTNAFRLQNNSNVYGAVSGYTWFGRVYDDVVSQRGGRFLVIDSPEFVDGARIEDQNLYPYPPGPVWTFVSPLVSYNQINIDTNFTYSAWTNISFRVYNSGTTAVGEVWENGSIIDTQIIPNEQLWNFLNPRYGLMFDGGIDLNTEQVFFDRKLTDIEMGQMFTYFNNKY